MAVFLQLPVAVGLILVALVSWTWAWTTDGILGILMLLIAVLFAFIPSWLWWLSSCHGPRVIRSLRLGAVMTLLLVPLGYWIVISFFEATVLFLVAFLVMCLYVVALVAASRYAAHRFLVAAG